MNKKTIKECLTCGKEFESYISANKKYCSKLCANRRQAKQITYHDFVCENCGKTFQRTGREVRNMNHKGHEIKYCSIKCKQEAWGKTRKETTCPVCGTVFLIQARLWHKDAKYTCSPECAKLNPDNRTIWKQHMLTIKCKYCGKYFEKPEYYVRKQNKRRQNVVYCSKECQSLALLGENFEEHGISNALRRCKAYKEWRKQCLERDNNICTECGSEEDLHVHHKIFLNVICKKYDYNIYKIIDSSEFNDINNGQTLCRKCHQKKHSNNLLFNSLPANNDKQ